MKHHHSHIQCSNCAPAHYITGQVDTAAGIVPVVSTRLEWQDKWEHIKIRLAIGRTKYRVQPGLYAVGQPQPDSPVMVTANYKLTFDYLRRELDGLNAWILVLDTKGINVWCAAGKGTFGTGELVSSIEITGLKKIITHKQLIVPQLGAPGVAAHVVHKLTGCQVIYGPIRAQDIPAFLAAGMKATPGMRQVEFPLKERLLLVPVEIVQGFRHLVVTGAIFYLLSGINREGYSVALVGTTGLRAFLNFVMVLIGSGLFGFGLLPWLPGRRFAVKGLFVGLLLFVISFFSSLTGSSLIEKLSWLFIMPASASFLVMNLTGSTPYTSLSGVRKEMRTAVPTQIVLGILGLSLWMLSRFF